MKRLLLLPLCLLLTHCGTPGPAPAPADKPATSFGGMTQIINVSAYDPKERQRGGVSYSQHDVSALRNNGARGQLISVIMQATGAASQ